MTKIYYPYDAFVGDLKTLTFQIDQEFDAIVAIARGGLSVALMLGEHYDIREVYAINTIGYEGTKKLDEVKVFNIPDLNGAKKVLIVDDIVDSGDTLREVLQVLEEGYPKTTFLSASIFYKPTASIEPTWWVKEATEWIEFFWSEDLKG
ncbi:MAG: phosphoribosyltransferase [Sulfurovaceae bacterium]|nr:phosphoribosyltransferase [Sulfurovaceae bacterium]